MADAVTELERTRRRYEEAIEQVEAVGEERLQRLADAYDELTGLFDRYEERATGSGDFEAFVEFQGKVEEFTEDLPDDLRHRDAFEAVDDHLQQRRLTESDFERARELLEPVADDVQRLDERERAAAAYRDARNAVERELSAVEERIRERERLLELGEADLDAPTERLREPIERYDDAVSEAFAAFKRESSARTVLNFAATAASYPLVDVREPPAELLEYVRTSDAGTETISQLLEYADYSQSKLDHYVDDPTALRRGVATRQTYLQRLDAEPFTVGWPPPEAGVARFRCRELESVVSQFAGEDAIAKLRTVREYAREGETYERLRRSAVAREELSDDEIRRLRNGAVEDELADLRDERDRLADALDEEPPA